MAETSKYMSDPSININPSSLFEPKLSDYIPLGKLADEKTAKLLFNYFRDTKPFKWNEANNDCEDRAEAICMLLDKWGITNCKGWVFNGFLMRKGNGLLTNDWGYHVAAMLPIMKSEELWFYVIDPATCSELTTLEDWAIKATGTGPSYFVIKRGSLYIFPTGNLYTNRWHSRNRQNHKWTMQGLAGINGPTVLGKAQLIYNKKKIANTTKAFYKLMAHRPDFL